MSVALLQEITAVLVASISAQMVAVQVHIDDFKALYLNGGISLLSLTQQKLW